MLSGGETAEREAIFRERRESGELRREKGWRAAVEGRLEGPAAQRVRHFLWLAARDRLFTNSERLRRHMADDWACSFCEQPESMVHVLRNCLPARGLWNLLLPSTSRGEFFLHDLCGWLWSNLSGSRLVGLDEWATIFSIACWQIWFWRNKVVFSQAVVPLEAKIQDVRRRVEWYRDATSCVALSGVRDCLYESIMATRTNKIKLRPVGQANRKQLRQTRLGSFAFFLVLTKHQRLCVGISYSVAFLEVYAQRFSWIKVNLSRFYLDQVATHFQPTIV
ncbi:Ribonuclease H-like superfamily protein [Striga hermonthica]|uniref:Ribonuclease H-like superfamily protein n=1 Tax=Striga hermonthica TaxID=68872 RepID=A0A9N7N5Z0_STRHE|nr:Ribonuclease H-like superfamily protein [Striga hermonthica]